MRRPSRQSSIKRTSRVWLRSFQEDEFVGRHCFDDQNDSALFLDAFTNKSNATRITLSDTASKRVKTGRIGIRETSLSVSRLCETTGQWKEFVQDAVFERAFWFRILFIFMEIRMNLQLKLERFSGMSKPSTTRSLGIVGMSSRSFKQFTTRYKHIWT